MSATSSSNKNNLFKDRNIGGSSQETTRLLAEIVRTGHDTIDIGEHTIEEMKLQEEKIGGVRDNLSSMNDITDDANTSIKVLLDKVHRKRTSLWIVIIFLFILNFLVFIRLVRNRGILF